MNLTTPTYHVSEKNLNQRGVAILPRSVQINHPILIQVSTTRHWLMDCICTQINHF